ncbi:MAG: Thioredoxin reductase [uncultured Chloroflexi bacterium]|uniref:Thioredoxin reductase n=1 Tax=uncultured Chloroflexota bacterium TaxID=166587 RepID=A0A6J4JHW7_9CHLR|nr:MAG: Thioredoxin reductase [uncultured Chloroflexota bacterium]
METSPTLTPAASARGQTPNADAVALSMPGISPHLDEEQLNRLRAYGTEHDVAEGAILLTPGESANAMLVVLDGEFEAVESYGRPDERSLARFGPMQFLGELGLLKGRRVTKTTIMRRKGRVLRIAVPALRTVMAQEPELSELLLRTFLLRHAFLLRLGAGLTLVGSPFDPNTRRLLEAFARHQMPMRWLNVETEPEAEALLCEAGVPTSDLPIVLVPGGSLLRNPSVAAVSEALGGAGPDTDTDGAACTCDLLIVGGGPGGLGAAVYGASEGLATALVDGGALGGQAGTSARIENYLGFPAGLSGAELTARAALQAEKFGARVVLATEAVSLSSARGVHTVALDDGHTVTARTVIIATGARYNRLTLERVSDFEGVSVFYAATQMEAQACSDGAVAVVGGANSAGQAALFLARTCREVHVIIRRSGLEDSMSRYLIDAISRHPRITVRPFTQVTRLLGAEQLEGVELTDSRAQRTETLPVCGLFVFIGASACTDWLGGQLSHDEHGFLHTGDAIPLAERDPGAPPPLLLETSRTGVFCVGDVRSGSVKRVATAIGEGAMAVRLVFDRIALPYVHVPATATAVPA